jgi:hypothetical protein
LGNLASIEILYLESNQLTGSIPSEMSEMTNLQALSLSWNALYTNDLSLDEFLDSKQLDGDWSNTQTIPPANPAVDGLTGQSVTLSWDIIEYTNNIGRYRVWCSIDEGGPYSDCGTTSNKSTASLEVNGLSFATTYYFSIRTETDGHLINPNDLVSDPSEKISATTTPEGYIFGDGFEE